MTAPVWSIDAAALSAASMERGFVERIGEALATAGFIGIVNHGLDNDRDRLAAAAASFFALSEKQKQAIAMTRGGSAWRGWFPLGGELTSGLIDHKEGLYFGSETPPGDPRYATPLHGSNLWPDRPSSLRPAVERWMAAMETLAQGLLRAVAAYFELLRPDTAATFRSWFVQPTTLFRIFRYPALDGARPEAMASTPPAFGVGEHTDYGFLTMLSTDGVAGLEIRLDGAWYELPDDPEIIFVNVGDMLERASGGHLRSTPHRVRLPDRERLSFPYFFDPSFDARLHPLLPTDPRATTAGDRWDDLDPHAFDGTYGEYLIRKVSRVFPALHGSLDPHND